MKPIIMPQVGHNIPSARIIQWRKKEGQAVEKGETVLVVESDKASFEVEAEASGVLLKVLYQEDEEVEILKPLGYIGAPGETIDVEETTAQEQPTEPLQVRPAPTPEIQPASRPGGEMPARILASPSARRVAQEKGIDLAQVKGTGPGGRITKSDVLAATATIPAAQVTDSLAANISPEDKVVPFSKMRKRIAESLSLSKKTIPHSYLFVDVDMSEALAWRKVTNEKEGIKITITDMVIKAAAAALKEFVKMNAYVEQDRMVIKKAVNIGVAIALDEGVLVGVIANADEKSIGEISQVSKRNAEAARRGSISASAPATFTVSSLGPYGVQGFLPIINPPECGILAVGTIEKRAVPLEEATAVRDVMTVALASDHRAVDGTYAAQFLNRIKNYLENIHKAQEHSALLQET
jgi:pyruvate dehydrogenase E2 component (dihydrolipoamide acetyltransferase)